MLLGSIQLGASLLASKNLPATNFVPLQLGQLNLGDNCSINVPPPYSRFFPAALTFAQRAFANAEIFALAALLILRLTFLTGFADDFFPFTFAHRAFCAAAMLARPAALIFRLFFGLASISGLDAEPKSLPIRFSSDSILSFRLAARRSCFDVRFVIEFIFRKISVSCGESQ